MKEGFAAKRANSQREVEFLLAIHREITEHAGSLRSEERERERERDLM